MKTQLTRAAMIVAIEVGGCTAPGRPRLTA